MAAAREHGTREGLANDVDGYVRRRSRNIARSVGGRWLLLGGGVLAVLALGRVIGRGRLFAEA